MGNAILVGFIGAFLESLALYGMGQLSNTMREILSKESVVSAVTNAASSYICEYAKNSWGVVLSPVDPLSKQSITGGVSQKIGIQLTDIFNKEALLTDVGLWLANELNRRYGTNFTSLYPLNNLQEQVENAVLDVILASIDEVEAEVRGHKTL